MSKVSTKSGIWVLLLLFSDRLVSWYTSETLCFLSPAKICCSENCGLFSNLMTPLLLFILLFGATVTVVLARDVIFWMFSDCSLVSTCIRSVPDAVSVMDFGSPFNACSSSL